ncbi:hypothetical protein Tco_0478129 [Tanacetum coccineum]
MSDSDESGITYTAVSSPYEDLSDIGSPRADDHEFLELHYMPEDLYVEAALQALPSPDYVPGPEEPGQVLRMPHPLLSHLTMSQSLILRQIRRRMTIRTLRRILSTILMMEEMTKMMRWTSRRMRTMIWTSRPMRRIRMMRWMLRETEPFETVMSLRPIPTTTPCISKDELGLPFQTSTYTAWSYSEDWPDYLPISSPPAPPHLHGLHHNQEFLFPRHPLIPSPSLPLSPPSPVLSAPPPSPIHSLGYRAAMIRMRAEAAATSYSLQ